ncbi:MAG: tetratricopeptide repeat protein [Capsulimonadales bacterium]|nr:tetratricopeptide repeat protein [Capsulimonadales bacterium]
MTRRRILLILLGVTVLVAGGLRIRQTMRQNYLATASFDRLLENSRTSPADAGVQMTLARRAIEQKRYDVAATAAEKAVRAEPQDPEAWLLWAKATGFVGGGGAADLVLKECLKVHPACAPALFERAKIAQGNGDYPTAFDLAEQAARIDARQPDYWRLIGDTGLLLRHLDTARDAFRKAAELTPDDWQPVVGMGRVEELQKQYAEAIPRYRDAVRLAPLQPEPRLYLANALIDSATTPAAYEEARQILAPLLQPSDLAPAWRVMALRYQGETYRKERKWSQALPFLEEGARGNPGDEEIHFLLISVYRGLGRQKEAALAVARHREIIAYKSEIRTLRSQVDAHPQDAALRIKLARLYESRGNIRDTVGVYRQMIDRNVGADTARAALEALRKRYADAAR